MVAFRRPDRLREISLNVPSSIIGPIVEVIQKPCQALESIRISVNDATGPSILVRDAFLGGSATRLREIKLGGISFPFPEMRRVLLSAESLVRLHLSKIPNGVYFSPDDLVAALSTLVQLERLSVGFHSAVSRPPISMARRPHQRTVLPSLTFLDFYGVTEYLEEFVARIDLPALHQFIITLFNQIIFEIPQFVELIPRLKALLSPTVCNITHFAQSVSLFLNEEGAPQSERGFFETSCRRLDWQLSFVTEISTQLSPLLSSVRIFNIEKDYNSELPTGEEDVDSTQWLELFQQFPHVRLVSVNVEQYVPGLVQALVTEDVAEGILPELTSLRLEGYRQSPSTVETVEQLVTTRRLSGRPIDVYPL
jgi:hypothetical protein